MNVFAGKRRNMTLGFPDHLSKWELSDAYPIAFFFGGLEAPYGVFELDLVGGLRGRPVKMVRGKVTGLTFPANAEIVLEGYVPPDRVHAEGPFGEWTGHYAGGVREIPVLDIKAIYYRNDPIVLGAPPMGAGT